MKKNVNALFVIYLDKFTEVFLNFLKNEIPEINFKFLVYGKKSQFKFDTDYEDVLFVESYKEINRKHPASKWATDADVIVFSGVFGAEKIMLRFPKGVNKKSFFHFWGGDFYDLREKIPCYKIKNIISKAIKIYCIKKVRGVITLISGEYDEFQKIIKTDTEHYIAPVCGDGKTLETYSSLFTVDKSLSPIKICLGNSATKSNNHREMLEILEKFKNEDICIICPLSYGNKEYAEKIIAYGKELFGDKFLPLTEYMDKKDYFKMLTDCRIGIFNNNRQQGMGNITTLLATGSKVYLKNGESMWKSYVIEKGYCLYDITSISESDFIEFVKFDEKNAYENHNKSMYYGTVEYKKSLWMRFFESVC